MKRRVDLSSVLFASSTLGLMLLTADCYYKEFKESGNIANRPGLILACLVTVVLIIQVIVSLKRKHPVDGSVYILDVDSAGNPEELHEVSESSIVELCKNDYDMEYNVEKWPELRDILKLEIEKKTANAKLAENLLRCMK